MHFKSGTSIIRTPLATGVRIIEIAKINTLLFEHLRKLIIFILHNYIHDKLYSQHTVILFKRINSIVVRSDNRGPDNRGSTVPTYY